MIHITDRTLSSLDDTTGDVSSLTRFLKLLIQTEPDAIEISQKMFHLLSPLPDYPGYIKRINKIEEALKYHGVAGFIRRDASANFGNNVTSEILLSNSQEIDNITRIKNRKKLRIQGLDNIITEDYLAAFDRLRKSFSGEIEFCPTDGCHFATALAVEWATSGMTASSIAASSIAASSGAANSGAVNSVNKIVTSFGGTGGFAPTEEVIMALKLAVFRKPQKSYDFFPEMTSLLNKITAKPVRRNKPVLGRRIFHVESGIHVDGILKDPNCYEPFPPETVGLKRKIVIGGQSGSASIKTKLEELGISCDEEKFPAILEGIRAKSEKKRSALNDVELALIVKECSA